MCVCVCVCVCVLVLFAIYRLASSYLSHVIESDVIRHHILTTEHAQLLALHVWFRCLAELDHTPSTTPTSHTTTIQQLTDQLHKLPLVTTLLGNQNTTPTDPLSMFRQLLEAMETSQVYDTINSCIRHDVMFIERGRGRVAVEAGNCVRRSASLSGEQCVW